MGDHYYAFAPWWPVFPLIWFLLIGTVIFLAVRFGRPRGPSGLDRARDILAERFARGELSSTEYRERLDSLR